MKTILFVGQWHFSVNSNVIILELRTIQYFLCHIRDIWTSTILKTIQYLKSEVKKSDLSAASTWIGDRRSSWIGHRWSKLLFFQNGSGIVDLSYFCCFENGAKSKHYLTTANRRKISLKKLFKKIFEVKTIEDLIWCGFFWKAIWIKKRKRQKSKATIYILPPTHKY